MLVQQDLCPLATLLPRISSVLTELKKVNVIFLSDISLSTDHHFPGEMSISILIFGSYYACDTSFLSLPFPPFLLSSLFLLPIPSYHPPPLRPFSLSFLIIVRSCSLLRVRNSTLVFSNSFFSACTFLPPSHALVSLAAFSTDLEALFFSYPSCFSLFLGFSNFIQFACLVTLY